MARTFAHDAVRLPTSFFEDVANWRETTKKARRINVRHVHNFPYAGIVFIRTNMRTRKIQPRQFLDAIRQFWCRVVQICRTPPAVGPPSHVDCCPPVSFECTNHLADISRLLRLTAPCIPSRRLQSPPQPLHGPRAPCRWHKPRARKRRRGPAARARACCRHHHCASGESLEDSRGGGREGGSRQP